MNLKVGLGDRLVFSKVYQKTLMENFRWKMGVSWVQMSKMLRISKSVISEGYVNGGSTIPYHVIKKLCKLSKTEEEKILKNALEIRNSNWGRVIGGSKAGKIKESKARIEIRYPQVSENLAEFIGIMLGDGSIDVKNFILKIHLHKEFDLPYVNYVSKLIYKLFGVNAKVYHSSAENMTIVRVNSKLLVNYLEKFKIRDKQIPKLFLSDRKLLLGVLRGLFDSDGSVHMSSRWCILTFTNNSKLLKEYKLQLEMLGMPCFISKNHVNVTSLWKIKRFMGLIGSSNLKNIIKFEEYNRNRIGLKNYDAAKLFSKYENIRLPYKMGL